MNLSKEYIIKQYVSQIEKDNPQDVYRKCLKEIAGMSLKSINVKNGGRAAMGAGAGISGLSMGQGMNFMNPAGGGMGGVGQGGVGYGQGNMMNWMMPPVYQGAGF